ncbi:MOSC domain-containing protein [Antrihabitans cavernicola]|uniref:MOSC domain-containing protein n=1 Tax=Antrihabitans cavernicola TaxID=2495913 RepID=A0A5A7S744_9NOCA|nr:MOSC N-terminal beta barrel domain-containing protein [Spelaeibacter cavernicola]KAA0021706.1 MOSC domain-containing protein [Spelaeibacter cavernicola]
MVAVTGLYYYPVKGCVAVAASSLAVSATGPRHDRSFMVVDRDGVFRSQRGLPALAVIEPEIGSAGDRLVLRAPGATDLAIDVRSDGDTCGVELFGAPFPAIDQGDDVADWLTDVLGEPSRLVRVPPDHHRVSAGYVSGSAGFADSGALTLLSESSLALLDRQIRAGNGEPVPMNRFRGNIVVEGWPEAHAEDRIRELTIGDARLGFLKLDIRCAVTVVDQRTGRRSGPEPLKTLARYRRVEQGGVTFGIKLSVIAGGTISVGDELLVEQWESVSG